MKVQIKLDPTFVETSTDDECADVIRAAAKVAESIVRDEGFGVVTDSDECAVGKIATVKVTASS